MVNYKIIFNLFKFKEMQIFQSANCIQRNYVVAMLNGKELMSYLLFSLLF